jgi:hypothetical protein
MERTLTAIGFQFFNFSFEYLKRFQSSEPPHTKMPIIILLVGIIPNLHTHASTSEPYIPTTGPPVPLEEICRPILGTCKLLKDT